jgi:uncharacterized SAM-binding protein YcdF (DUF218 family)
MLGACGGENVRSAGDPQMRREPSLRIRVGVWYRRSLLKESDESKKWFGLLRRRECWIPTWRAWTILLVVILALGWLGIRKIYPFLAVSDPHPGGLLVVEGWAPDYALETALQEFKRNHYDKICVTGGFLDNGAVISEYKTYAELGVAVLMKLGLSANEVQALPSPPVRRDRTYASALSFHRWLEQQPQPATHIHLFTEGAHARRSRLLFEKALGPGVKVSVTAVPAREFDERHWWRYSAGVRGVIGETLAYLYARLLFSDPAE